MTTPTKPRPLVLGEVAKIEELAGIPAPEWDDSPQGKLLAATVFVYKRRQDKTFTWNDALGLELEEAQAYLETQGFAEEDEDAPERPTKPAKKPAARSRRASKTSARSSQSSD